MANTKIKNTVLDSSVISGQSTVTAASNDLVLIQDVSDSDNLKKALVSDFETSFAGIDDQSSSNDDQLTITDSAVIINEDSDDVDFRVESNGQTHALFVDGALDNIGIGYSAAHTATNKGLVILTGDGNGGIQLNKEDGSYPSSGETLGSIGWKGADSANSNAAAGASIVGIAAENFSGSTEATNLAFNTKPTGTGPGSAPTERMRIDSAGNVLVGTTDAQIYDHSSGEGIVFRNGDAIDIARSGDSQLTLNRMSNEGANISLHQAGTLRATIGTKGSGGFYIGTGGDNERMRIDSSGNVAIGTTDTSDVQLRVDQNENDDYTAFFKNTCAANAVVGVTYSTGETVNAANKFGFQILDNGTERFAARMDGSVFSSNSTYSSDIRLKENIEDCEPMLEKLRQVRIVDFDWKDGKGPDGRQRGVIAQEIEPIFPELIHEPVEYKEFKKSEMIPILVKALQEQQTIIEDLKARIETLEG